MQNVFDEDPPFVAGAGGERLRRIACHDQRPILVRPAKEKVLDQSEQARPEIKSAARRAVLRKNRRLVGTDTKLTTDSADNTDS